MNGKLYAMKIYYLVIFYLLDTQSSFTYTHFIKNRILSIAYRNQKQIKS